MEENAINTKEIKEQLYILKKNTKIIKDKDVNFEQTSLLREQK